MTSDNKSHGSATIHREKNVEIEDEGNQNLFFLISLNQANNFFLRIHRVSVNSGTNMPITTGHSMDKTALCR